MICHRETDWRLEHRGEEGEGPRQGLWEQARSTVSRTKRIFRTAAQSLLGHGESSLEMAFALLGMKSTRHKRNVAIMDSTPSLPCLVKIIDLNKMSFEDEGGKYLRGDDAEDNERQIPRGVEKLIVGMRPRRTRIPLPLSLPKNNADWHLNSDSLSDGWKDGRIRPSRHHD